MSIWTKERVAGASQRMDEKVAEVAARARAEGRAAPHHEVRTRRVDPKTLQRPRASQQARAQVAAAAMRAAGEDRPTGGRTYAEKTCKGCEDTFAPRGPHALYCTDSCRERATTKPSKPEPSVKHDHDQADAESIKDRYFELLAELARQPDPPEHVFDRLERLAGVNV